jgi:hypothetical protein
MERPVQPKLPGDSRARVAATLFVAGVVVTITVLTIVAVLIYKMVALSS